MSLYPWFSNLIVSKQSHLGPFPRYKSHGAGGWPSFWYHAIRWRHRPTYCIMHCKDDQCRAPWRHWPNCAGVRPSSGITPYDDVTDRLIASRTVKDDQCRAYDVIDRVLQVFDPFSENASYPFSEIPCVLMYRQWNNALSFILEWQRLHFYRIVVQMLVSYRNKCPNLHHPVRIRFSRERQCFWNVWHPVRSNNVETTFVCFLSCRCKVWCGVVGVFHIFHSPIAIENISRQGDLSFQRCEWYPDIPRISSGQVSSPDGATVTVDVGPRMSARYL